MKQLHAPLVVLMFTISFTTVFPNVFASPQTPEPGSCQQRPACLDATPACKPPEPQEGWCESTCFYQEVQCVTIPCYPVLICPSPPPPAVFYSEGTMISAVDSSDPDIYIVNSWYYKRLFLNPAIFNFYGHLGGWHNVVIATPTSRDAYLTSTLVRNCEANDPRVWAVEATGEDTGTLHHMQITGERALEQDHNFFKRVFCINNSEFNWYAVSDVPYTSVGQAPKYAR